MTNNTQPEALRLANVCSNLTRYSMDAHLIAAELRRQHARIAELEATPKAAPLSDDTTLLDGLARLNWYVGPGDFYCDEAGGMNDYDDKNSGPEELRQAIRAALAAQKDTP